MTRHRTRRFAAALAILLALLVVVAAGAAAEDFGGPEPGRHVYDRAGVLSSSEIADLEQRALAVEQAGAPVVVYLRAQDASFNDTVADARELMDAWHIQSAPGARDGLVIFFNLEPGDLAHGHFAVSAGEKHVRSGALNQDQLDRIADEILPLLREGQLAAGIAVGLDAIARNLTLGPPPPPPPSEFERAMAEFARGPLSALNALSLLVAGGTALFVLRKGRARPSSTAPIVPTTQLPADVPPALAGALVRGRIDDAQIEATILHLARRGALAIEPVGKQKVQVRLLDASLVAHPFERAVWDSLVTESVDGVLVPSERLRHVRARWDPARAELRAELEARGWYDPDAASRRWPLYLAGFAAMVLGLLGLAPVLGADQPWGMIGVMVLEGAGILAVAVGASLPETTPAGETAAAPWRGYRIGLQQAEHDPNIELDLDRVVPYAVAMHAGGAVDERLKEASKRGYVPAWLDRTLQAEAWDGGFYPYWASFHSSVSPATTGAGGGGASSGSAASGGSF